MFNGFSFSFSLTISPAMAEVFQMAKYKKIFAFYGTSVNCAHFTAGVT